MQNLVSGEVLMERTDTQNNTTDRAWGAQKLYDNGKLVSLSGNFKLIQRGLLKKYILTPEAIFE